MLVEKKDTLKEATHNQGGAKDLFLPPFPSANANFKGIEASDAAAQLGLTEHWRLKRMVSSSQIGRTAGETSRVFELLLNDLYDARRNSFVDSLLIQIAKNTKEEKIVLGDFGCGGAADAPLLQRLGNSKLVVNGIKNKSFEVRSFDLSNTAVEAVKSGKMPYFCEYSSTGITTDEKGIEPERLTHLSRRDEAIQAALYEYLSTDFEFIGPTEVHRPKQNINPLLQEIGVTDVYLMKESARREINIAVDDIIESRQPDNSLHLVSCYNVAVYFSDEQLKKAFFTVERILKEGGYFLCDGAVFQKVKGRLGPNPITGYEELSVGIHRTAATALSRGLHPTVNQDGVLHPAAMRTIGRKGKENPSDSFIHVHQPPYMKCD